MGLVEIIEMVLALQPSAANLPDVNIAVQDSLNPQKKVEKIQYSMMDHKRFIDLVLERAYWLWFTLCKTDKAIEEIETNILYFIPNTTNEKEDRDLKQRIYGSLAILYGSKGDYEKAKEYHCLVIQTDPTTDYAIQSRLRLIECYNGAAGTVSSTSQSPNN